MEKFIYRFFPTVQFVFGVLMVICLSISLGYHTFAGNLNWFCGTLLYIAYYIVWRLAISSYKEMRQAYREDPKDYLDFED